MKKFENGKRYEAESGSTLIFEIIKRTAKTVTYTEIQHAGKCNESKSEPKRANIKDWNGNEAFITNRGATIIA